MIRLKKACLIAVGLVMTLSMSCVSASAEPMANDVQASYEITDSNDENLQNNGANTEIENSNEDSNDKSTENNIEENIEVKPFEVINIHDKLFLYVNGVQYSKPGWVKEKEINEQATADNAYYIEEDGAAALGWKKIDGNWYYFNEQGIKQTGWQTIKNVRYCLDENGVMQKGWKEVDGVKYYFDDSGNMAVGKKYIDGKWYYFGSTGQLVIGTYYDNGNIYYCDSNGVLSTDKWISINESKFYAKSDGSLAVGKIIIDGKLESFDSTGKHIESEEINVPYLYTKVLNVGDADCTFIKFPNGETALIDTGTPESSQKVIDFLNTQNLKKDGDKAKIDYIVITHGHSDHIGGLKALLENFEIGKVYMPSIAAMKNWYSGVEETEQNKADLEMLKNEYDVYTDAVYAMKQHDKEFINTVKGEYIDSENILQFIQSDAFFGPTGDNKLTENFWGLNNNSAILYLKYGNLKMLFPGDLEWIGENNFQFNNLLNGRKVDVLKVCHHGNDTSSTPNFLKTVNPKIGIISRSQQSVKQNTAYGNLINKGISLYETSTNDGVAIYSTSENWTVCKN